MEIENIGILLHVAKPIEVIKRMTISKEES
jgi:hypothetical protein